MATQINIRQETTADHAQVFDLVSKAFLNVKKSNQQEAHIVERLRKSDAFLPELSLVAIRELRIVGHILISKIKIKNAHKEFESLSLAPVSVHPDFQKQGIGSKLINYAHEIAKKLGYDSVVLVGHAEYYPRFGYKNSSEFGIEFPFDSPDKNCMAIELNENALKGINGMVEYPKEFFG